MTEQSPKVKVRKLRAATETMRERAERVSEKDQQKGQKPRRFQNRFSKIGQRVSHLRVWVPFKFVGRFVIPPYIRASWRELRMVTWPDRKQTRDLTGAVIMFSVVFGLIIAAFDYGLDNLFKRVILK